MKSITDKTATYYAHLDDLEDEANVLQDVVSSLERVNVLLENKNGERHKWRTWSAEVLLQFLENQKHIEYYNLRFKYVENHKRELKELLKKQES